MVVEKSFIVKFINYKYLYRFMKRGFGKSAQIWVETVIYTLIALIMIGVVLSVVKPKIEQGRDQAIIEQSLGLIKDLDSIFTDIKQAPGNQRIIELNVKKGNLIIDSKQDKIIFEIESSYEYSESGEIVEDGASGILISTQKLGKVNNVTLIKNYDSLYNITYFAKDELKSLSSSPNSYKATILNRGQYRFTDLSSSCITGDVSTCINPQYQEGYSKYCVSNYCKYVQDVLTINIDIT